MEQYNEANVLVEHLAYLYEAGKPSQGAGVDSSAETYSRRLARRVVLVGSELQAAKDAVKALLQGEPVPASLLSSRPQPLHWDSPTPKAGGAGERRRSASSLSTTSSLDGAEGTSSITVSPIRTHAAGTGQGVEAASSRAPARAREEGLPTGNRPAAVHRTAAVSGPISSPIVVHFSSPSASGSSRTLSPRAAMAMPGTGKGKGRSEAVQPRSPQVSATSSKGKSSPASARAAAERASVEVGEALQRVLEREKAAFADKARQVLETEVHHARAAAARAQAEMKVAQELRAMHEESEASVQELSGQVQQLSRQLYVVQQEKEGLAQQLQALRLQHGQLVASRKPDVPPAGSPQSSHGDYESHLSSLRAALSEAQWQADTASMAASKAGVELDKVRVQAKEDAERARAEGAKAVEGIRTELTAVQSQYKDALSDLLRLREQGKVMLASMDAQAFEAETLKAKQHSTEEEVVQLRALAESLEEALERERVERTVALLECSRLGREGERAAQEASERLVALQQALVAEKSSLQAAHANIRAQEETLSRERAECEALRARAHAAEQQVVVLQAYKEGASSSPVKEQHAESMNMLRMELAKTQELAQTTLRSLGESREREGRLQAERSELKGQIEEIRRERDRLQGDCNTLRQQTTSASGSSHLGLDSALAESRELRSLLSSSHASQAAAERRAALLDAEVRGQAGRLSALESELASQATALHSANTQVTSLQGQLARAVSVACQYESMLELMEEQAQAAHTAMELLKAQVEATRDKVEAADGVVQRVTSVPPSPTPGMQPHQHPPHQQQQGVAAEGSGTPRPAVHLSPSPASLPGPDSESPLKIVDQAVQQTGVAMKDLRTVLGVTRKAMADAQAEAAAAREQAVQARLALTASESQVDMLKQQLAAAQAQASELAQQLGALKAVRGGATLPALPPTPGLPPLSPGQAGIAVKTNPTTPQSPQVSSPKSDSELALKAANDNLRDLKVVLSATRSALTTAQAEASTAREQAVQARIAQTSSETQVVVLKQQLESTQTRLAEAEREVGALKAEVERGRGKGST